MIIGENSKIVINFSKAHQPELTKEELIAFSRISAFNSRIKMYEDIKLKTEDLIKEISEISPLCIDENEIIKQLNEILIPFVRELYYNDNKYVHNPQERSLFIENVLRFINEYLGFRLDYLNSEYKAYVQSILSKKQEIPSSNETSNSDE